MKKCSRTLCFGWTSKESNRCSILKTVYRHDYDCPFFKIQNYDPRKTKKVEMYGVCEELD